MIATEPYAEAFSELDARRAADPEEVRNLRRQGIARFQNRGWPTAREEDWRNTNVSPIASREFFPAPVEARNGESPFLDDSIVPAEGPRAVFVDGRFAPGLSTEAPGCSMSPLRDALAADAGRILPLLSRLSSSTDPFAMLNDAFLEEGIVLEVPKGRVLQQPIHLVFRSSGSEILSSIRNLVLAGEGSAVTLVETFAGTARTSLTNSITQIAAGQNSAVEHVKIQRESLGAFHVGSLRVEQARDSRFLSHLFSTGAALARNNVHASLDAEGAECSLNGLFFATGTQRVDNFTVIDHARPHGTSRELYKGILDGEARGAFTGRILVRAGAQKTDSQQSSQNLILSRDALVNSTPQLEILANDVKCKHGATTGQLDSDALFYLRSRGLSEEASRNLLTYAFAAELVQRVAQPELRRRVDALLHGILPFAPAIQELA